MAFHVGQKVVCVRDDYAEVGWGRIPNRPCRGEIYTIRGFARAAGLAGYQRIWLVEMTNPECVWTHINDSLIEEEGSFGIDRFRPLIERKSSTSTGFEILDDIRKRESVDEPVKNRKRADA